MKVDKDFCMSSYLTFRYVYEPDICFKEGIVHRDHQLIPDSEKSACKTAEDMDSAILASYMPPGTKAYTARCIGENAIDETVQARKYCDIYNLEHVIVDVTWDDYLNTMDELMLSDGSPIIPNEPQAYKLAKIAKENGATCIIYGDCADTEFGGMTKLLSKDWTYDGWVKRYTFVDPKIVLKNPVDVSGLYDLYRIGEDKIDFVKFISEPYALTAAGALTNGFRYAGIDCVDPYERLKMAEPLDLQRVRSGDSKYLIRELFKMRYPMLNPPEKIPMADAEVTMIPQTYVELTDEQDLYKINKILDLLDEDDDVQNVYHNWDE